MSDDVPILKVSRRCLLRLRTGHLWVFREDISDEIPADAPIVCLCDDRRRVFATAFCNSTSTIAARLLAKGKAKIDRTFILERVAASLRRRRRISASAFRVVNAEADGLPGVIVDRYGEVVSFQTLCRGAEGVKEWLVDAIEETLSPAAIVERNDATVRSIEKLDQKRGTVRGTCPPEVICEEDGRRFAYDVLGGQKTGGFLDQRENRPAAAKHAWGRMLDCFCYAGGFSIHASAAVESITAVDASADALRLAERNMELNGVTRMELVEANAFDFLREAAATGRRYDTVVLDPPPFTRSRESVEAAIRGYKEINLRALKVLPPEGILVSCCCSHHVGTALFEDVIREAAADTGRAIQILGRLGAAHDHPVLASMPETEYLKCFVMRVL